MTKAETSHTIPAPHSVAHMREKDHSNALESDLPDARTKVARSAFERNLPANKLPAKTPRKYRVNGPGGAEIIEALDALEARAKYNDSHRSWPSPRASGITVQLVLGKGETYEEAKKAREPRMMIDAPEIPEPGTTGFVTSEEVERDEQKPLASETPGASEEDAKKAEEALKGPQRHAEPEDQPKRLKK